MTTIDDALEQPVAPRPRRLAAAASVFRQAGLREVIRRSCARVRAYAQIQHYDYNLRRLYVPLERIPIDRPIFLLGVQGGGGTLIARTLYRHPQAVYAGGNSRFWAGIDEIHNCHHTIRDLPEELIHRSAQFHNLEGKLDCHPVFGYQRYWLYAVDELFPLYRRTADQANAVSRAGLERVVRKVIRAYAPDVRTARFVDMSQLYTIQAGYVAELLRDTRPKFILLSRNPYATCARAVVKEYDVRGTRRTLSREERIRFAVEHWDNSLRTALADGASLSLPLLHVRYEDFLDDPQSVVRRMSEFAELEFDPRQVPGPGQPLPLGSEPDAKWYPLRRGENRLYLDEAGPDLIRTLNERSADLIARLGYSVLS